MVKKNIHLSIVLAVYNEEKNLQRCLESVVGLADELVIVDGGSMDHTVDIAQKYNAHIIETNNPAIFHINKQKAVDGARGEWILQLDADEVITENLKNEILHILSDPKKVKDGYFIARKNYFFGQWIQKGGMYPNYVIRLFKNGKGHFPCKSVHEQIEIDGTIGHLENPMIHTPYPTFSDYLKKANTYTSLTRDELLQKKLPVNFVTIIKYLLYLPAVTFVNLFIRHQGFRDGFSGFVWALFSGLHHAQAFIKYSRIKTE